MKKLVLHIAFTILLAGLLLLNSCSENDSVNGPLSLDTNALKLKIGQMIMVGFRGKTINDSSTIAKDIIAGKVGGIILFDKDAQLGVYDRNIESPEQVTKLISDLQSYSSRKLFVAIDQEGGKVNRLKTNYGFPATVSEQYLGTLDNEDTTRKYARQTAETLFMLGFNVNFAPVVDLNINPESPAIGKIERSFSIDPAIVVKHSQFVIDEHKKKKIACVLKHFPGHGSAGSDSHLGITDVTNTWQESELEPYKQLLKDNTNIAVMTAHIFNSNLDADYPATLSKRIIDGILRNQIGYNGIVFSDDMNMSAISSYYGFETALELSINAGVDVVVIANNLIYDEFIAEKAQQTIYKLVMDGRISFSRIESAYNKIISFKNGLN